MSAGRTFGFGLLGFVVGGTTGAGLGLLGGLGYTQLADVVGFEGEAGYAVVLWALGGLVLGLVFGVVAGVKLARRSLTK
jgi:hypothetical protein